MGAKAPAYNDADSMKQVRKSVLLWYSAQEMYDLVTDVEAYPRFLPWCDSARVVARHDDGVTARIGLHYLGLRHAFTTRNIEDPGRKVTIELVDGPFSRLDGEWRFVSLGQAQAQGDACKIEFDLRYAFASGALQKLVSPVFDRIANTFVDAFVKRAESVYGSR
jgi:ribosome-associated toxin RatA of RatAB toxin-antitoxin module